MGNPYPTKSKPIKIGRKHTGAPSLCCIGRRNAHTKRSLKMKLIRFRQFKAKVAEYWNGERESYPTKPKL